MSYLEGKTPLPNIFEMRSMKRDGRNPQGLAQGDVLGQGAISAAALQRIRQYIHHNPTALATREG